MTNRLMAIMERAAVGEYGEESELIGKIAGLFNAAKFDQGWGPFICGAHGEQGSDGLHESYAICPCYGADVQYAVMYTRKRKGVDVREYPADHPVEGDLGSVPL